MRILVMSDCHHSTRNAERAISEQPAAKDVFYLGDGSAAVDDLRYIYPDRNFYIVSGNCDFLSLLPESGVENIGGTRIFYCHGHNYNVNYGTDKLYMRAADEKAEIALYGHTHIASAEYRDGIYLINPGSLSQSREGPESYAVIDITPAGILPAIIKV